MNAAHGSTARWYGIAGAVLAGLAVAAGAFGTHALRSVLPTDRLAIFETAARYQMYHGLALLAVAWVADRWPSWAAMLAGSAFALGIVLFCGSLVVLALTGQGWLGMIAPVGGASFVVGWAALAWAFAGASRRK
ncbi:MAG: DUF423 domain-containing protein [Chloroflexota bacterium]|nr:DUF423 domain-containing protein [Dehalococcoidia bacterium]MDW8254565.1 DUF423 domain-containing protein [Chloroflexota bacterium]